MQNVNKKPPQTGLVLEYAGNWQTQHLIALREQVASE